MSAVWGDVERRLGVVVPADLRQLVDIGGGTEVKLGHTARARIWSRSQMRVPSVALEHGIVPFATLTTGSPTVFAVDLRRDDIQPVMRARIDRASELTALNFPLAEPLSEDAESVEDWIRFRLRTHEP